MNNPLQRLLEAASSRQWGIGIGLAAAGLLLVALPVGMELRRSIGDLRKVRATFAAKQEWLAQRGTLEQRVRDQEAALATLEARLLKDEEVGAFTQTLVATTRATGAHVTSVHPLDPSVVARPKAEGAKPGPGGPKPQEERNQGFLLPVRLTVQGEYTQLCSLAGRLASLERACHLMRAAFLPESEHPSDLSCSLEVAGFSLRPLPKER